MPAALIHHRPFCPNCLRPEAHCYCHLVQPFDPGMEFVILIHKREAQKKIATGRMSYLCLENSRLLPGYDNYSEDASVNAILADPGNHSVLLFPGENSIDIGKAPLLVPEGKNLVVFVIDGTWATAKKTLAKSRNLQQLPRICFYPDRPSGFRVRKQPKPNFFSTIEAIHQTIELLSKGGSRTHDTLLEVFDLMVTNQLEAAQRPKIKCLWKPPRPRTAR